MPRSRSRADFSSDCSEAAAQKSLREKIKKEKRPASLPGFFYRSVEAGFQAASSSVA
jgi:hypothetical protein